jgi:hypothetical protein
MAAIPTNKRRRIRADDIKRALLDALSYLPKSSPSRATLARLVEADAPPLKSGEVAKLLGVRSKVTVKNWMLSGDFPGAYRSAGGHWLFPVSDVLALKAHLEESSRRSRGGIRPRVVLNHDHSGDPVN